MAQLPTTISTATNCASNPHAAVLAFPFGTHAAPLLSIVSRLAASAPNTLFSFFSTEESNTSLLSTHNHYFLPNLKAYNVSNGAPEGHVCSGKNPMENIELFMKAAPENYRKAVAAAASETGRKVSCLVNDSFHWFTEEMAAEMEVSWVPCWISGSCSLSAHVYTDLIRETLALEVGGSENKLLKFIPGMSKIRIRDLPEEVFSQSQSYFSHTLLQVGQKLPHADVVFVNCFEELNPTIASDLKSKFKQFLCVGPFSLISPPPKIPDTNSCLPWLDRQKPASVAYVGFGSVSMLSPDELVAMAEALEACKVPFIWSIKRSSQEALPNGFLERTKSDGVVVNWAPQLDVLAHNAVGVFVNHGGWNSVMESIGCGVPLICRPFFGDHRINARMIEDVWEIGVNVEGGIFTKSGLVRCLDLILGQQKGKKMRENVRNLKQITGKAIGPGGSSMKNLKILVDIVSTSKA